jgi:hypothetical protein
MINVAIQQGNPSSSNNNRLLRQPQQQQSPLTAKGVYQTVIVPTAFPSGQYQKTGQRLLLQNFYYQQQPQQRPKNNNEDYSQCNATPYHNGPVYQQYSFMQQQLHQFRQRQTSSQQKPGTPNDRNYVYGQGVPVQHIGLR